MPRVFRSETFVVSTGLVLIACGGDPHLVRDLAPRPANAGQTGAVYVVVEISAGETAKYEVDKDTGKLEWQRKHGRPRVIDYLPYPGNYGFIPRTLSAKEDGGDGDPLDVLVLGAAQPKGSIIRVHLIGVLKLLDEGEQDDKLIAVPVATEKVIETPLTAVRTLAHLNAKYPGIDTIVETWFANYDGSQTTKVVGWDNETEAERLFEQAERAYASQR